MTDTELNFIKLDLIIQIVGYMFKGESFLFLGSVHPSVGTYNFDRSDYCFRLEIFY